MGFEKKSAKMTTFQQKVCYNNDMWTKEELKEYQRQYYLAHKEDYRQKYLAHKEEMKESRRLYYLAHKEERKEYYRKYASAHKEEIKKQEHQYFQTSEGKAASQRGHIARRARMSLIANTLTCEEWYAILDKHEFKCAYCGCSLLDLFSPPTRDHIIPISRGGNNTKDNIVPACRRCNSKKGARSIE